MIMKEKSNINELKANKHIVKELRVENEKRMTTKERERDGENWRNSNH